MAAQNYEILSYNAWPVDVVFLSVCCVVYRCCVGGTSMLTGVMKQAYILDCDRGCSPLSERLHRKVKLSKPNTGLQPHNKLCRNMQDT